VLASDLDHIVGGNFPAEFLQVVEDFVRKPDAEVRTDQVGFEIVPIDLGAVRDLVIEGFEKAGHGRMSGKGLAREALGGKAFAGESGEGQARVEVDEKLLYGNRSLSSGCHHSKLI